MAQPASIDEARGGTLCLEDIESISQVRCKRRLLTLLSESGTPPETRIIGHQQRP